MTLEGYKDLRWGMSSDVVRSVLGTDSLREVTATGDRMMRWARPEEVQLMCGLFCGPALQQAFWLWYGVPAGPADPETGSVKPEIDAIPETPFKVMRVWPYDEYVTLEEDHLVAYWFPLSVSDWDRAVALIEKRYGEASKVLPPVAVLPMVKNNRSDMPFSYAGKLWFGPITTLYALTETYRAGSTESTLGYVFYVSSLLDQRNQFNVRLRLKMIEEKGKTTNRDEDYVRAIIE